MTDRTGTPATAGRAEPRTVTGLEPQMCHWHQGLTGKPILISIVEQNSGPGMALYACPACRRRQQLVPWAERER